MSISVLLLDGHTVQAISVARSLKQYDCKIYAFLDHKLSFGYACRYIDEKKITPNVLDEKSYLDYLEHFLLNVKIDVIIPLYDDSSTFLSKYKGIIETQYDVKCAIEDYDKYVKAANKSALMSLCKIHNIPHPNTAPIVMGNIDEVINYVGFPAMIKPNVSAGARGIVKVDNKIELQEKLPYVLENFGASTLQKYIENSGTYYNVMMYRDKCGKIHENIAIKIMRYFPLKGGTSCYCKVVKHDYLFEICKKTLDIINWHGFADFDIMEEKNSGKYYIIEINPRVPASIHAGLISNINYPRMIVEDVLNKQITENNVIYGNEMRFMGLDVMWFLFSPDRFRFKPSWFKFLGKKIFYQDGSWKDPFPMLMGCLEGIVKYMNPSFRKAKLNK